MLYKGKVHVTIEIPAWVEAETVAEAREKLESMTYEELVVSLDLHNVLDLFNIEEPEEILYQEV